MLAACGLWLSVSLVAHLGWMRTSVTQAVSVRRAALSGTCVLAETPGQGPRPEPDGTQHQRRCQARGLIHSTALHSRVLGAVAATGDTADKTLALPKRGAGQNPRLTTEYIHDKLDMKRAPEEIKAGKPPRKCWRAAVFDQYSRKLP